MNAGQINQFWLGILGSPGRLPRLPCGERSSDMYYVFIVSVIRILRKYWIGIIRYRLIGVSERSRYGVSRLSVPRCFGQYSSTFHALVTTP
jgi:hypothetical protein